MRIFIKAKIFFCHLSVLILLSACNNADNEKIEISRFEVDMQRFTSSDTAYTKYIENKYSQVISLYIDKIYGDSPLSQEAKLDSFANSPAIKFFYADVEKCYKTTDDLAHILWAEKQSITKNFEIGFPKIYTAIIPFNQSIILDDSIAIIGLNHYLGKDYEPYSYFPEYKRLFKIKEKIPYDICEAVLKVHFPYEPQSNTLLESMLYEGMIIAAMQEIVPQYNDTLALSLRKEQLEWCRENEKLLWNQLLIDDILYTTSPVIKSSLLNPAPFSEPFSQDSPGQAGRWLGRRIISAYIRKADTDISTMLKEKAYRKSQMILMKSGYDGQ